MPRQGQGKVDDVRWVFAGKHGPGNLEALERCDAAGDVDELVQEMQIRLSSECLSPCLCLF